MECTYSTFTRNICLRKRGPTDWWTCLCNTCVNPEMKLEKLNHYKKINQIVLEGEIHDDQSFKTPLNTLDNISLDKKETLIFPEWKKVENPLSKS